MSQGRFRLAVWTRRALDPGADRLLWPRVSGWRPSFRGAASSIWRSTPRASRPSKDTPVWERWSAGPPDTANAWAGLDARGRGPGTTSSGRGPAAAPRTDRPPQHAYALDGRHVRDVPALYLVPGEAVNGPGGYSAPGTLLWRDAPTVRRHVSGMLTPVGPTTFRRKPSACRPGAGMDVTSA